MVRTKHYLNDIRHEPFESVRPLLEQARRKTKPRTVDLYGVFCAVLHLLCAGPRKADL